MYASFFIACLLHISHYKELVLKFWININTATRFKGCPWTVRTENSMWQPSDTRHGLHLWGTREQRGTNSGRVPQQTAMATAFDNITPSLYTRQTDTLICAGDWRFKGSWFWHWKGTNILTCWSSLIRAACFDACLSGAAWCCIKWS